MRIVLMTVLLVIFLVVVGAALRFGFSMIPDRYPDDGEYWNCLIEGESGTNYVCP